MPGLVGVTGDTGNGSALLDQMTAPLKDEPYYLVDRFISDGFLGARVHLGIFNPDPQPAVTSGGARVFFDGRCYGNGESIRMLRKRGYAIRSGCDASYCAAAFEEWGSEFVRDLNGAFICVIAEPEEARVMIANDRYGLLPLSYAVCRDRLLFSTHLSALLEDPALDRTVNPDAVLDFFAFGELFADKTFLRSVSALPGGSVLHYGSGRVEMERYWDYPVAPDSAHTEEWFVDELVRTWRRAMALRVEAPHRYGVALSGGLDSRTIVGGLPSELRGNVIAHTHGDPDSDEVLLARKVARVAGMTFLQISLPSPLFLQMPDECIRMTDGLDYIGVNYIPKVSRLLREAGIEVLFHGMGLDTWLAGGLTGGEAGMLPRLEGAGLDDFLYQSWRFISDEELDLLFRSEFRKALSGSPRQSFDEAIAGIDETDSIDRHDHFALASHLCRLAPMGPRLWRTATEVALPGFDNDWVDVALQIPSDLRLNRRIYRKFLSRLAPDLASIRYNRTMVPVTYPLILWRAGSSFQYRKDRLKSGINRIVRAPLLSPAVRKSVDVRAMLRDDPAWDRFFRNLLLSPESRSAGCLEEEAVRAVVDESRDGTLQNISKVLYLATFELFLRSYGLRPPGDA